MIDQETRADLHNLSEEELRKQFDYVEKRITNGLKNADSFDLLEAESTLMQVGSFSPSSELTDLVLERINGADYHKDFDLLRLTGYLRDKRIRTMLEKRYEELKIIWKDQDELRLAESYKTMLGNVARRANEINALKVAADPYMNTLDQFFEKSFNQRNLDRFPQLKEVQDDLYRLRKEGKLSKDNMLAVLDTARNRIEHLIQAKMVELDERYQGNQPKPNRVIAIYYCLMEALLGQESEAVNIDDEFLDKIFQDFRAAIGHGTKRFVLNTLLKFSHPGFAEIASEARYSLQPSAVEKCERKEQGEAGFKYEKIDLNEMQIYELYKTAAEVIAANPVEEVFHTLLHSYNVASLLLGLRALQSADLPPAVKLRQLRVLLDLGTVNDYVYIRAMDVLSDINNPESKGVLTRLISDRYGWRKVRIPERAFKVIIEGFGKARSSGDINEIAALLIPPDRRESIEAGEELTYPFEPSVYDRIVDRIAQRFEKNPFHGVNEIAQHRLFEAVITFVTRTPSRFAPIAKRRAMGLVRRLTQVSRERLVVMTERIKEEYEILKNRRENLSAKEMEEYRKQLLDLKKTVSELTNLRGKPPREEAGLRKLPKDIEEFMERKLRFSDYESQTLTRSLQELVSVGPAVMEARDRNILATGKKKGYVDETMLTVRFPASTRAVLRAAEALNTYIETYGNPLARRLLGSLGLEELPKPLSIARKEPAEEKTLALWEELKGSLEAPLTPSELLSKRMIIALVTMGAAAHKRMDVLDQMQHLLYNAVQPAEARLAFLLYLPIEAEFAGIWSRCLGHETESVFFVLKQQLGPEGIILLKGLVPDLLNLLD